MPAAPANPDPFNLLENDWIPVLYCNGRPARVGILKAFADAGVIRQVAASNPMDNIAVLRFLIAVLLWCRPEASEAGTRLLHKTDGIPVTWLDKLELHKASFNLLGEGERFYQDPSLRGGNARPIADLLVEFPGADSVNHLRHVIHDGSYGFCPACCALGLLRLSVWAPANRFYPASVNPASAAYLFISHPTLALTILANLPQPESGSGAAPWLSAAPSTSPPPMEFLAWRPRKLWLNTSAEGGQCANCGVVGSIVDSLCNEAGWATPVAEGRTKKYWEHDPHLLKSVEPISLPGLGASVAAHSSSFWRAALRSRESFTRPAVAIGPVVNKFAFQDAVCVALPSAPDTSLAELSSGCSVKLRSILRRATPNPARQHPETVAAVVAMTPDTEARVRSLLGAPALRTDLAGVVKEIYSPVVEHVVAATVRGSSLRRRAAAGRAVAMLSRTISELANKKQASDTEGSPKEAALSKRRRGGEASS